MAQTHDIEDVLSSIRRLVANETGPAAKSETAMADRSDGPMLVLGESHRVTEPEDPFQMIRSLAQEERDDQDADHLTDEAAPLPVDAAGTAEDATGWDTAVFSASPDVTDDMRQGRRNAARQAANAPTDYAEDTDYDGTDIADLAVSAVLPVIPSEGGAVDNLQPASRARDAAADTLDDLSSSLGGDEALRDLIAEIVRQELAGDLGERITRNVRKLVRREIRQMLASDEFD